MSYIIFFFLNLSNFWIWEIVKFNLLIAIVILLATLFLSQNLRGSNFRYRKLFHFSFIFLFTILIFFQVSTNKLTHLTEIKNDDRRLIDMRLKEYPPTYITLGKKVIWLPMAHWFEERKEMIIFSRITKNFSEIVDPNLYFFGNHPRERVGVKESLKFPFTTIPFFMYGIFIITKSKQNKFWLLSLIVALVSLSIVGSNNPVGPFILYPFISTATAIGAEKSLSLLNSYNRVLSKLFLIIFLIIYFLVVIQGIYVQT